MSHRQGRAEPRSWGDRSSTSRHFLPERVSDWPEETQLQSVLRPGLWAQLSPNALAAASDLILIFWGFGAGVTQCDSDDQRVPFLSSGPALWRTDRLPSGTTPRIPPRPQGFLMPAPRSSGSPRPRLPGRLQFWRSIKWCSFLRKLFSNMEQKSASITGLGCRLWSGRDIFAAEFCH